MSIVKNISREINNEKLRQIKETFDQRKTHEKHWFKLRLFVGYSSIILLLIVLIISCYVIVHHESYSGIIINSVTICLFVDLVALIATVWKMVLNPRFVTKLDPIIRLEENDEGPTDQLG